jgi:hypothetical protein
MYKHLELHLFSKKNRIQENHYYYQMSPKYVEKMNKKYDLVTSDSNSDFIVCEMFLENKCNSRCLYIEL